MTVLAQVGCQWIDFAFFHLGARIFDSDHHKSLFGAASLLAQAGAAAAIVLRAAGPSHRRAGGMVAGALVAVLVVVRTFVNYDVEILLPPVTALFALICWLASRDPRIVQMTVFASLVLLACSLALHTVGPAADTGGRAIEDTWTYQLLAMLKHSAELAGWILLATGMLAGSFAARVDSVTRH